MCPRRWSFAIRQRHLWCLVAGLASALSALDRAPWQLTARVVDHDATASTAEPIDGCGVALGRSTTSRLRGSPIDFRTVATLATVATLGIY